MRWRRTPVWKTSAWREPCDICWRTIRCLSSLSVGRTRPRERFFLFFPERRFPADQREKLGRRADSSNAFFTVTPHESSALRSGWRIRGRTDRKGSRRREGKKKKNENQKFISIFRSSSSKCRQRDIVRYYDLSAYPHVIFISRLLEYICIVMFIDRSVRHQTTRGFTLI